MPRRRYRNQVLSTAELVRRVKDSPHRSVNIARKEAILERARTLGVVRYRDVVELCGIGPDLAYRLISELVAEGLLRRAGRDPWDKGSRYEIDPAHPRNQGGTRNDSR